MVQLGYSWYKHFKPKTALKNYSFHVLCCVNILLDDMGVVTLHISAFVLSLLVCKLILLLNIANQKMLYQSHHNEKIEFVLKEVQKHGLNWETMSNFRNEYNFCYGYPKVFWIYALIIVLISHFCYKFKKKQ